MHSLFSYFTILSVMTAVTFPLRPPRLAFAIVGFHMTSLKLSILLRFYFHGALEQLKTNFQTNFNFKRFLAFVIEYA